MFAILPQTARNPRICDLLRREIGAEPGDPIGAVVDDVAGQFREGLEPEVQHLKALGFAMPSWGGRRESERGRALSGEHGLYYL